MQDFLKGWAIHYNYFRPHLSLHDHTPAQMAGIDFTYASWKELIEKQPYYVTARIPVSDDIEFIQAEQKHKPKIAKKRIKVSK
jgi:hypothetical protein